MKKIPLTRGKYALVDDEDYPMLSKYKWCADSKGYAVRREKGTNRTVSMHRQLAAPPKGMEVDHKNGNKSDNQRENLRVCTRAQNARNCKSPGGSSRFRGVSWNRSLVLWDSYIHYKNKKLHIEWCRSEEDAAVYHDVAAQLFHGPFARLNFPIS